MSETKTVEVKIQESCPRCDGKGYLQEEGKGQDGWQRCPLCRGDRVLKSTQTKTVTIDD